MPGDEIAGIDLGISNFAAVSYSTEDADFYPGNRLKQDGYYFPKEIANCEDSGGERATRLHHKRPERRTHFFHSLTKHLVERCGEKGVGRINVGDLEGVREDCNAAFNADVNGPETIRLDLTESDSDSASRLDGDRCTGWLAQPGVDLYDLSHRFSPREQVVDCKP